MQDNLEFIFKRRSIRTYLDQPIDDATVVLMLKAAMAAPSAMNMRPWCFVVARDPEVLKSLRNTSPISKMNAPCAIVVCGDLGKLKRRILENFWVQDCSAATENLLLAASTLGLGAVWCGVHPINRLEKKVAEALELPNAIIPFALVFVGHSAEEKPARTQFETSKIYVNKFGRRWE